MNSTVKQSILLDLSKKLTDMADFLFVLDKISDVDILSLEKSIKDFYKNGVEIYLSFPIKD